MKRIILAALAVAAIYAFGADARRVYSNHFDRSPIVLGTNPGGGVLDFIGKYDEIRRSKRDVIIDGICISACTMVAGLIPPERVCVTPFAKLAFHSASLTSFMGSQHSPEGTRLIWRAYSENVRELLRKKGWDGDPPGLYAEPPAPKRGQPKPKPVTNEHENLIYVEGDELLAIFRACS